jgi:phosphoglycerate-specific signal transduction histidine kinase
METLRINCPDCGKLIKIELLKVQRLKEEAERLKEQVRSLQAEIQELKAVDYLKGIFGG